MMLQAVGGHTLRADQHELESNAVQGEIIVDPVNVSDAGACCEACAQQRQNAIGSHSQEADELCNFW